MSIPSRRHVAVIRQLMILLVARDYSAIERRTNGIRLSADVLRMAVSEYGRTLVMPPDQAFASIDMIRVTAATDSTWSVRMNLWTIEEGRSDITLECTLIDRSVDYIAVEVDNLHVL